MLKLDDRDLKILTILQTEGRITKAALAERVNLTPTPAWERLRRLEKAGIIEGYGAQISLKALGAFSQVFMEAELESHRAEDFARFEAAICALPEITACWAVGGGLDYLLQVMTPNLARYQTLVDGMLEARIGLKRYFTYAVTKQVKAGALPLETLLADDIRSDHA
jgi:Lrp/AsnC family transcriptional regulator of ectoine degradation